MGWNGQDINCDEYKDIEDYKEKLKKIWMPTRRENINFLTDPEWRKKHEENACDCQGSHEQKKIE